MLDLRYYPRFSILEAESSRGIDGGNETNEERLRVRWQLRLHLVHLTVKMNECVNE